MAEQDAKDEAAKKGIISHMNEDHHDSVCASNPIATDIYADIYYGSFDICNITVGSRRGPHTGAL